MKTVAIPTCRNPFVVIVNHKKYTYTAGETVEVPDEVAEVIQAHVDAQPVEAPKEDENPIVGGEKRFELIGTIDFSTDEMAKMSSKVEYDVNEATEILAVWTDMVNTSSSHSHVVLNVNGNYSYSVDLAKTSKSGGVLNGYTRIKIYEGIGATFEISSPAISATNYTHIGGATETSYVLLPLTEKINKLRVGNPGTQYYAVGGILKIYAR
jgi:hypothetical protein